MWDVQCRGEMRWGGPVYFGQCGGWPTPFQRLRGPRPTGTSTAQVALFCSCSPGSNVTRSQAPRPVSDPPASMLPLATSAWTMRRDQDYINHGALHPTPPARVHPRSHTLFSLSLFHSLRVDSLSCFGNCFIHSPHTPSCFHSLPPLLSFPRAGTSWPIRQSPQTSCLTHALPCTYTLHCRSTVYPLGLSGACPPTTSHLSAFYYCVLLLYNTLCSPFTAIILLLALVFGLVVCLQ